ncbi:GTP cyclohydrolase FolE2 [Megamonas hypermegale]|uniref:GTP cyclohydrolase FolE2 n=1 Tax=Megamonas hypermegale TaxID=158847 RepID=A0A921L847_9FIRM|nr:GTP cyclohydrolase FolE2 [Megamonas hypermegale]MDM8143034.1 GTP cyclohydrolase FolE2 [Megamonas hypermegale]HJF85378.1 GTP cyclohydrolase FolE2 [Megamonas hypermegale]
MQDVQNRTDKRGIAIQRVGISEVYLPLQIKQGNHIQPVVANIKFTVDLPMEYKGTHMSRFQEILTKWHSTPIGQSEIRSILDEAIEKLGSRSAHLSMSFKYFIEKTAPVSGKKSLLDLNCKFSAAKNSSGKMPFMMTVKIPVTSLCPCSKEISAYGAHNQRSIISVKINYDGQQTALDIRDIVSLIEAQASCPLYPLLKREDEKYVTEKAYENPKFVEDILRDCVLALRTLEGINYFSVECENFESIHNHNAYASHIEYLK